MLMSSQAVDAEGNSTDRGLREDPLLSYVRTALKSQRGSGGLVSRGSTPSSLAVTPKSVSSPGYVDVRPWTINFEDVHLQKVSSWPPGQRR
jgi:hypothetical protein